MRKWKSNKLNKDKKCKNRRKKYAETQSIILKEAKNQTEGGK